MTKELFTRVQHLQADTRVNGAPNFPISLDQKEPVTLPMSPLP